jgi:formamidopyrimidine-DNA glycosylase
LPELPEVETLVRGLKQVLPGLRVSKIEVNKPKMWQGMGHDQLINHAIVDVRRIAKMIVIGFDEDLSLITHLKMTGQLIFEDKKGDKIVGGHPDDQFVATQPSKYTHITYSFTNGVKLFFNDMRQFGYAKLVKTSELGKLKQFESSGVEPFDKEFTAEFLYSALQKKPKVKVKQVLMDQAVISGIGNIYANESLFNAGIMPDRLSAFVTEVESNKLYEEIVKILNMAIDLGGTSYKDFVHHTGKKGTMQDHLMVYHRDKLPCLKCGNIIKRMVIGGRGSYYCSACQS